MVQVLPSQLGGLLLFPKRKALEVFAWVLMETAIVSVRVGKGRGLPLTIYSLD